MLLLSFYTPGIIFGIFLFMGFKDTKLSDRFSFPTISVLSTIIYALIIFFCNRDLNFSIKARHLLSGGVGAILLLVAISICYQLKFKVSEYLIAFLIGLGTTFFQLTDTFESFNPWLMFLSIGLWQIGFSFFIDNRLKTKLSSLKGLPTTSVLQYDG